jgi:hypothetical protein
MKKFLLYIVLFLLYFSINVFGQSRTLKNEIEAKALSRRVADLFIHDSLPEAFEQMYPYWPIPKKELDNLLEKTITTLKNIRERYGDPIGNLKLKEEKISDIALRETYILRYTYHALRMILVYYRNNSGWIINAFTWDDSFHEEFKQP